MSKSIIYAGSNTAQATTVNGTVLAFNNIVRRYGDNLEISGGNVVVRGGGYYNVNVNITATGATAGTLVVSVYKDGVAIPYATTSLELAADGVVSASIPCVVRECGCGCNCSTITVVASGLVASVTNAAIDVVKE